MKMNEVELPLDGRVRTECTYALAIKKLSDTDREAIERAMRPDSGWSAHKLYVVLRKQGIVVGIHTLRYHRKGECACVFGG